MSMIEISPTLRVGPTNLISRVEIAKRFAFDRVILFTVTLILVKPDSLSFTEPSRKPLSLREEAGVYAYATSLLLSTTDLSAWNVGGQRPTKIPALCLPLKNNATEAPIAPSVRM